MWNWCAELFIVGEIEVYFGSIYHRKPTQFFQSKQSMCENKINNEECDAIQCVILRIEKSATINCNFTINLISSDSRLVISAKVSLSFNWSICSLVISNNQSKWMWRSKSLMNSIASGSICNCFNNSFGFSVANALNALQFSWVRCKLRSIWS